MSIYYSTTTALTQERFTELRKIVTQAATKVDWWLESLDLWDRLSDDGIATGSTSSIRGIPDKTVDYYMAFLDLKEIVGCLAAISNNYGFDWELRFGDQRIGQILSGSPDIAVVQYLDDYMDFCGYDFSQISKRSRRDIMSDWAPIEPRTPLVAPKKKTEEEKQQERDDERNREVVRANISKHIDLAARVGRLGKIEPSTDDIPFDELKAAIHSLPFDVKYDGFENFFAVRDRDRPHDLGFNIWFNGSRGFVGLVMPRRFGGTLPQLASFQLQHQEGLEARSEAMRARTRALRQDRTRSLNEYLCDVVSIYNDFAAAARAQGLFDG